MKHGKKTLYSRKIISLLAAVLSALLLSACGGAKTEGDQQTAEAAENAGQQELPEEDADAPESQTAQNGSGRPETEAAEADAAGTNAAGTAGAAENAGDETAGDETASNSLSAWLTEEGYLDLDSLHRINPDIYAWLDIPGTDISFPILQSAEDEYFYLSHNESKEADDGGCIYTEYFNRKDFSDPNTVIYGRNVDGRFALLHQFQDRDFFDANRTLNIYLEDRVLRYQIFAAYNYDDRHLIKIYDFWDKDIFSSYLETVFSQRAMDAYVDDSAEVTAEDKIITLSTGVTGQDDRRYLVQAVLVS
ncbi:MAG TPA: class B sortase [Candidatus Eisenbergiella pullistercoris]|uniref:Class B sortase n=1 Tax=Candidatus Eisenbergiella pullistercoris TaxID=2838555 RepID=A0A9D1YNQ4_9FIRM|nr:class B sortase [Candidatus Eisenbergiella pullistercoris]